MSVDPDPLAGPGPTLDPEDWEAFRALGHRMVDDVVESFRTVRERPVWQPVPEGVRASLHAGVPLRPEGPEAAYADYRRLVEPYPRGNTHPRFWGWVNGSGLPLGVFADFLAAAMNPSVGAFENSATMVEEQVLDWLKEMLGFPAAAGAVLTSGCSMSNLIALAVARSAGADCDVRRHGVAAAPRRLVLYASAETHSSVQKAVELLGLGSDALRRVPVGPDYRIEVEALERAVRGDRRAGLHPFCVVGNAGTVNTGAVDALEALADLCEREGMWLHVDGAFGALAWLCPGLRPALRGLQRADSLAFDLHKWMYLPYDVGCVLVRDAQAHRAAFSLTPNYLSATPAGPASHPTSFADCGIELTRRFRALKVWLCLKEHGLHRFARQIGENVRQARYLAARVEAHPQLELAAPVSLNVVCFRYVGNGAAAPEALDALNADLLVRLQTSGIAVPSHTRLHGRFVIRAAFTNHRTRTEDVDVLVEEVVRLGNEHTGAAEPRRMKLVEASAAGF
jgi:glutamate/tyrosine decarboxylase-like PLP-dependent enzyme